MHEMKILFRLKILGLSFLSVLLISSRSVSQTADGVYATSLEPLQNAVYQFVFTPSTDIAADAEIDIVFPLQINLSRILHAGSSTLGGGFAPSVVRDTLKLKRDGRGRLAPAGTQQNIKCAMVINPVVIDRDYTFEILFRNVENDSAKQVLTGRISPLSR